MTNTDPVDQVFEAIESSDADTLRSLLTKNPELAHYDDVGTTLLHYAAEYDSADVIGVLVEFGCDPNAEADNSRRDTPLFCAFSEDKLMAVVGLLRHGADPNMGRHVISSITGLSKHSLEMVKSLEQYGADLHRVYPFADGSNINALSMAIAWEKVDVVEYLRSKVCVMPDQPVAADQDEPVDAELVPDEGYEVIAYFNEHFGPVQPQALIEIVPTHLLPCM